jgi:hypothetical protein
MYTYIHNILIESKKTYFGLIWGATYGPRERGRVRVVVRVGVKENPFSP